MIYLAERCEINFNATLAIELFLSEWFVSALDNVSFLLLFLLYGGNL
jgi:hypothetical protein